MSQVYYNGLYPKRGEIYYIKKSNTTCTGSETWSDRHAVIVSVNSFNRYSSVVQVVYITTKPKSKSPTHVDISTKTTQRIALCEQVTPVDKSRIVEHKGFVSPEQMKLIDKAIGYNLGIENQSEKPIKLRQKYNSGLDKQPDFVV